MTRRLIMVRHGETTYNATRRMQGQLDTELSPRGIDQARAASEYLGREDIGLIISSDLSRAHETARLIGKPLGIEPLIDARLRETKLGQWQGKTHQEIDTNYPGARARWRHDARWTPPGGESRLDVARRARPVIDELMRDYSEWDDSVVLLVAHGGTIAALTGNLLGLEVEQFPMLSGLANTRSARLTARPKYVPGSTDALDNGADNQPRFNSETVPEAQWYLDAWNQGM